ncbi:hypothetical protein [Bacillus cereus group sp. IBL03679]|uniref:hypothetical protein n=1 Tax=Bacillus cereus group sp. IBL03679 TaxID=3240095 RepID=UPI003D2F7903
MLMKWEYERFAADKQCIERALVMWEKWMGKCPNDDDSAAEGLAYVFNHMKLKEHQVSLIHDFFNEYMNLLEHGEEQAEAFYKTIMRM